MMGSVVFQLAVLTACCCILAQCQLATEINLARSDSGATQYWTDKDTESDKAWHALVGNSGCSKCDSRRNDVPCWWQYDIGSIAAVRQVNIITCNWRSVDVYQTLANFEIFVGQFNVTESTTATLCFRNESVPVNRSTTLSIVCPTVMKGRYVTIKRLLNNEKGFAAPNQLALDTVFIYGERLFDDRANNRLTRQSGIEKGFDSSYAVDGDLDTCSLTFDKLQDGWFWIDLGREYGVQYLTIYLNETDEIDARYLNPFEVLVSKNATVKSGEVCYRSESAEPFPLGSAQKLECPKEMVGRYLTIQRLKDFDGFQLKYLAICDLKIYGRYLDAPAKPVSPDEEDIRKSSTNQSSEAFQDSPLSVGAIIGIVIGGVAVLILFAMLLLLAAKVIMGKRSTTPPENNPDTSNTAGSPPDEVRHYTPLDFSRSGESSIVSNDNVIGNTTAVTPNGHPFEGLPFAAETQYSNTGTSENLAANRGYLNILL